MIRFTEKQLAEHKKRVAKLPANHSGFKAVMEVYAPGVGYRPYSPAKPSKMRNKRVQTPQGAFSSIREARRYQELLLMAKAGHIRLLERQTRFPLNVRMSHEVHICDYVADFSYYATGPKNFERYSVEDVKPYFKSDASRKKYEKTGPYRMFLMKKRLMMACLGIDVVEV